jgi:hypothetical protein
MNAQHTPVIGRGAGTLARQVLELGSVAQFRHRRRIAIGFDVSKGIAALIDQPPQPTGFLTRRGGSPVGKTADCEAALTTAALSVIQNEAARAGLGDANTKAGWREAGRGVLLYTAILHYLMMLESLKAGMYLGELKGKDEAWLRDKLILKSFPSPKLTRPSGLWCRSARSFGPMLALLMQWLLTSAGV